MYSFIFMNVARLITLTKRKSEILSDLCDKANLFLCRIVCKDKRQNMPVVVLSYTTT